MKLKSSLIYLIITVFYVIPGCVTTEQLARTEIFGFENDDLSARLEVESDQWVTLKVTNKKNDALILQTDLASFSSDGSTEKLIPSGTMYIDSNRSQPPITIPPQSSFTKGFSSASASRYVRDYGWKTENWIPANLVNTKFVFGYKEGGREKFIVFKGTEISKYSPTVIPALGKVNVEERFWNYLFVIKPIPERREALRLLALKKAKEKFGPDVEIRNLQYEGQWSPLSLVLYFSMLGFVENASLEAEVFKPK